jgi:hypothetical protein
MIPLEVQSDADGAERSTQMISSIQLTGYRGFERFEMVGVGRVNLLVGTNNSGKTSVLEAIDLLTSRGDPVSLWSLLWRRGERLVVVAPPAERAPRSQQQQVEAEVCHLFTGHEVHPQSTFTLTARNQTPERSLTFTIVELSAKERVEIFGPSDDGTLPSRLALQIKGSPAPITSLVPLSQYGSMAYSALETTRRRRSIADNPPSQFITTDSLSMENLVSLWNNVALKPEEELVLRALRFFDNDIERIATQSSVQPFFFGVPSRGGFIVKRKGVEQPIPIGSMGDGMWRMLAMAIAITQCKDGVLLVDEIDTGLHYTVMADMWRLIHGAAKEFNVQVFATTHSFDCVHSLACVCVGNGDSKDQVTLHRIERGKSKSIPYSEEEIRVAAERNIEMR